MDTMKTVFDVFAVDGASNMQKAGRIIQAAYPRATVIHGVEHVLSLVFEDIAKIPAVKVSDIRCISVTFETGAC